MNQGTKDDEERFVTELGTVQRTGSVVTVLDVPEVLTTVPSTPTFISSQQRSCHPTELRNHRVRHASSVAPGRTHRASACAFHSVEYYVRSLAMVGAKHLSRSEFLSESAKIIRTLHSREFLLGCPGQPHPSLRCHGAVQPPRHAEPLGLGYLLKPLFAFATSTTATLPLVQALGRRPNFV